MNAALTLPRAAAFYTLAAVVMTWPVTTRFFSALPADLGDPLLNAWILAWGADHVSAIAGGDVGAFTRWWNANIFHPAPLALAYSEHLTAQVITGLPVWWMTGNVFALYNTAYLLSHVVSGVGTFLLVRELTGRPRAALVAGLFFAFVPYRIAQASHLQVLWSQWMPLTLFALRRHFERRSPWSLAAALAALVAQQLSCGYYLVYFTPFVALYAAWELTARRLWRDTRLLAGLAAAAVADLVLVWPFVAPYLQLRALEFGPRPLGEVAQYSADTLAYFTVHPDNRFWGPILTGLGRRENELFAGLLPMAMAAAGLAALGWRRAAATAGLAAGPGWRRWALGLCAALTAVGAAGVAIFLLTGGFTIRVGGLPIRVRQLDRNVWLLAAGLAGMLLASARARAWLRWGTDLRGCALVLGLLAVVLSWGPSPTAGGRPLGFDGPYLWLYQHVPGFDGLRVPARCAMVAYVFLAVLAGYGLAALDRLGRGGLWMALAGGLFLLEATAVPVTIGRTWGDAGVMRPEGQVAIGAEAPPVYRHLATLPPGVVVAEFPFGYPSWELRYVFYSSVHHHRLVNGYSGGFPQSYMAAAARLKAPLQAPDAAWEALESAGVTHVIVHRGGMARRQARAMLAWLEQRGGRRAGTFGSDELVALPR